MSLVDFCSGGDDVTSFTSSLSKNQQLPRLSRSRLTNYGSYHTEIFESLGDVVCMLRKLRETKPEKHCIVMPLDVYYEVFVLQDFEFYVHTECPVSFVFDPKKTRACLEDSTQLNVLTLTTHEYHLSRCRIENAAIEFYQAIIRARNRTHHNPTFNMWVQKVPMVMPTFMTGFDVLQPVNLVPDTEYNQIATVVKGKPVDIKVHNTEPPKPSKVSITVREVSDELNCRLALYFHSEESGRGNKFSNTSILPYFPLDTPSSLLLHHEKRNEFTPKEVLEVVSHRIQPIVRPFFKANNFKSDGTRRVVYAMDVTYEAFLRECVKLRAYRSEYSKSIREDWRKYPVGKDVIIYDIKSFDTQVLAYVRASPYSKLLLPKVHYKGKISELGAYPSGILFTSALTRLFVESLLYVAKVPPDKVWISGDAFCVDRRFAARIKPYTSVIKMREVDNLNGFRLSGGLPQYVRAMERLSSAMFLTKSRLRGRLLWAVRYRAYEAMNAVELPDYAIFLKVCAEIGEIWEKKNVAELGLKQLQQWLQKEIGVNPRCLQRALHGRASQRVQDIMDTPGTEIVYASHPTTCVWQLKKLIW